jgi:hypothetical protein
MALHRPSDQWRGVVGAFGAADGWGWVMFILILTMGGWLQRAPVSVESVPGFYSEAACMAAGKAWLEQANKASTDSRNRALCVRAR